MNTVRLFVGLGRVVDALRVVHFLRLSTARFIRLSTGRVLLLPPTTDRPFLSRVSVLTEKILPAMILLFLDNFPNTMHVPLREGLSLILCTRKAGAEALGRPIQMTECPLA